MALGTEPRLRAPEAVYELLDLLRLAQSAIRRAQPDLHGEASSLALRLSRQLQYLRGVSELLEHEATRPTACGSQGAGQAMAPVQAAHLLA